MTCRASVQGAVCERADGGTIALRVAGLDRPGMLQQYFDMLRAQSHAEFVDVMARLQVPTFNIVYADKDGHIQYTHNGILPKRSSGDLAFWSGLVPGDMSDYLWTEIHPLEDLPIVVDPDSGFVQNANDPPWLATYPVAYAPSDFAPYMAIEGPLSLRAQNSVSMLLEEDKISFEEMVEMKLSAEATALERLLPDFIEAAAGEPDPEVQAAINLLSAWDGVFDADANAALLFEEFMTPFATVPFAFPYSDQAMYDVPWSFDAPLSTPSGIKDKSAALDMLKAAITTTKEKYGAIDRTYGDVSRFVIGDKNLAGRGSFGNLGAFNVINLTDIN